jgi:hypothetical protein
LTQKLPGDTAFWTQWVLLAVAIVVQLSPKSCIISSFLQTEQQARGWDA